MEGYSVSRIFISGMVIIVIILSVQIILIIISRCIVQGTEKRNKFFVIKFLLLQLISKIVVFCIIIIIMADKRINRSPVAVWIIFIIRVKHTDGADFIRIHAPVQVCV